MSNGARMQISIEENARIELEYYAYESRTFLGTSVDRMGAAIRVRNAMDEADMMCRSCGGAVSRDGLN